VKTERLDQVLVERGIAPSREKAKALVLAGQVIVGEHRITKPGTRVDSRLPIRLKGELNPYVSRGGLKLVAALEAFDIDPAGKTCVDVGASTGGFTDCLLQAGARRVYAVDVGYGQLAWKLRQDPRVLSLERENVRLMPRDRIPETVDLVVVDASFISLRLLLPKAWDLLDHGGEAVVLVKPQFEVGRGQVGKGGVVRDPEQRHAALENVCENAKEIGFAVAGTLESPVPGAKKGNVEYLVHLCRAAQSRERE
jgi:23S rRNA (cytidine1920-2'-O)/16S rRNA (cytidine1409-2'-O)-methyltransferase